MPFSYSITSSQAPQYTRQDSYAIALCWQLDIKLRVTDDYSVKEDEDEVVYVTENLLDASIAPNNDGNYRADDV